MIVFRKLDIGRTDILDASFGFGRTEAGNSLARMICINSTRPSGYTQYERKQRKGEKLAYSGSPNNVHAKFDCIVFHRFLLPPISFNLSRLDLAAFFFFHHSNGP